MIWALVVTHGPTPWSLVRVMTTRAPSAIRSARRYVATLRLNRDSVYPLAVAVPVVSQVSSARPFQTIVSMEAASLKLPPSWPGSMPTVLPARGSLAATGREAPWPAPLDGAALTGCRAAPDSPAAAIDPTTDGGLESGVAQAAHSMAGASTAMARRRVLSTMRA